MYKLIISVCFAILVLSSHAAEKKTYALSKHVYRKLQQVNELIDEKQYVEAQEKLSSMLEGRLSTYERAQVWYTKGSIFFQVEDMPAALDAFKQTVQQPEKISELLAQSTLRAVIQLTLSLEQTDDIDVYLQALLSLTSQPEVDHALAAQVFYKQNQLIKAQEHIDKALNAYSSKQIIAKESALLLANAIQYERTDYKGMLVTLNTLLAHYPKPKYVLFLASIYGQLGEQQKQTTLLESLYEANELYSEAQYISLASLYIAEKTPYKGAIVLQKAIEQRHVKANQKNYELLSQAFLMAQEFDASVQALATAANLADTGELYLRLAYLEFDRYRYQPALDATNKALAKGFQKVAVHKSDNVDQNSIDDDQNSIDDDKIGETYLLRAMLLFYLEEYDQAIVASQKASDYPASRKHAEQWVDYIRSEQQKLHQLTSSN